ncbi:hypothetical protein BS47DRAFT_728219 [Hydnum rufescens UP504]|uniref:FAD-binding domain-containing protein n=1 Tax=Hydnum rufescens UP504 TaxID=1448309 RepID=A0A9P6B1U9_9AGAM|nr:hypothetical protein BS47DRAFT_728219 [Hydnum rufescens UP504]
MNTALMDAHNLSQKLHLVLSGLGRPQLLSTYHDERWKIGKRLIDFDEEYSALFSGEIPKSQPHLATLTEEERAVHFTNVQRRNADLTTGVSSCEQENGYYPRSSPAAQICSLFD